MIYKIFFYIFVFRGLCSVYRSTVGRWDNVVNDNDDDAKTNLKQQDLPSYGNNAHWLPNFDGACPGPSNYALYYDAASLYPASGKS